MTAGQRLGVAEELGVGGGAVGRDHRGHAEELVDGVVDVGPDGEGQVRRQRPRRRRPRQEPQRSGDLGGAGAGVVGVEREQHGDRRVLAGPVGVVLAGLEVRQRGLALPAVGEDPLALVEQALVPERLERPHDALHVGEVHGLVVVGEVDPPGLAGDVALPGVGGALDQRPAVVVEAVDAVLDDAGPARELELLLRLHLGGQAVAVPSEAPLDPPAPHRLVAGHGVLHEAGEEVAVVGEPVGEGRAVVEDELVVPARSGLDRGREGPVCGPELEDLLLEAGVVGLLLDLGVRRLAARRVGHAHRVLEARQPPGALRRPGILEVDAVLPPEQGDAMVAHLRRADESQGR